MDTVTTDLARASEPAVPQERANAAEYEHRLLRVTVWLLDGVSRRNVIARIQSDWPVGERMAQLYVQEARRRLTTDAEQDHRLYYLALVRQQQDRLLRLVFDCTADRERLDPRVLTALAGLLRATCRLLETRDKIMAELHERQSATSGMSLEELNSLLELSNDSVPASQPAAVTTPVPAAAEPTPEPVAATGDAPVAPQDQPAPSSGPAESRPVGREQSPSCAVDWPAPSAAERGTMLNVRAQPEAAASPFERLFARRETSAILPAILSPDPKSGKGKEKGKRIPSAPGPRQ